MDEDEAVKFVHLVEQVGAMLRDLSPHVAGYYQKLIDEGMDPDQALYLTAEMQRWLLGERTEDED